MQPIPHLNPNSRKKPAWVIEWIKQGGTLEQLETPQADSDGATKINDIPNGD